MPAFPPVTVLLVRTTPALEPRTELVAPFARLLRLGTIAGAALALRIHGEPPLNERRLRLGRVSKAEDGQGERDRRAGPPRLPPPRRSSLGGGKRIVACPHHARNIGCASALQALRRSSDRWRTEVNRLHLKNALAPRAVRLLSQSDPPPEAA
jgi:hypothetical protein